jgi:hypothetical protein
MALVINTCPLFLSITSPEDKYQVFPLTVKMIDCSIGKLFPPFALVSTRTVGLNREYRIE